MRLPGFTAEASVNKSANHYSMKKAANNSNSLVQPASNSLVQPAINYGCLVGCHAWCRRSGAIGCNDICRDICN